MRIQRNALLRSLAFAALTVTLSLSVVIRQVSASPQCEASIAELRAATEVVGITGKNAAKDRAGLLAKLDGASAALARGKLCTAIQKLRDFRNKVNQLIVSGSINTDPTLGVTGQDLVSGADEAIACIEAQVAQSGTTCPVVE